MVACAEDSGFSFPKNLSVWWSEETEYLLQRIERWAAYARGYNRLRSVRLSPGRMTMQEEQPQSRWSINRTTNRLEVESNSWSPTFRQRRQSAAERSRLRCCALSNLDYKSNGNLDSNCLEAYSLDHSIYFKTIGEIRNQAVTGESTTCSDSSNGNNYNYNYNYDNNSNGNNKAKAPASTPLDCGDFLSSDFDELDDEELDEAELEELGCQLGTVARDEYGLENGGPDVIQLCRSVISEDEINNNFTATGMPRNMLAPATLATTQ